MSVFGVSTSESDCWVKVLVTHNASSNGALKIFCIYWYEFTKVTEITLAFSQANLNSLLLSIIMLEKTSNLLRGDKRNQIPSRYADQKNFWEPVAWNMRCLSISKICLSQKSSYNSQVSKIHHLDMRIIFYAGKQCLISEADKASVIYTMSNGNSYIIFPIHCNTRSSFITQRGIECLFITFPFP